MKRIFRGKGKAPAGSSSNPEPEAQRQRRETQERAAEEEDRGLITHQWKSGSLSQQPSPLREEFFRTKMNSLKDKTVGFICEKEVPENEFKPFGVIKKFKALGWEAALKCHDRETKKLYAEEIEDWVATLKLYQGSSPSKVRLEGYVNDVKVTMSFDTLNEIAKFDSKGSKRYVYPDLNDIYIHPERHSTWSMMLDELFVPGADRAHLHRDELKLKPKMLHLIMQHNVIPRRGDKTEVRFPEVPILYALFHGKPLVSFRYLVIYNIWLSRDSIDRKIIPHCRLITALLKKAGVITSESVAKPKRFTPFNVKSLGGEWVYLDGDTHHVLRTVRGNRKWSVLKESNQDDSGDEEVIEEGDTIYAEAMEEDEENEDQSAPNVGVSAAAARATSSSRVPRPSSALEYDMMRFGSEYAFDEDMRETIRNARPDHYGFWPELARVSYDHTTQVGARQERAIKQLQDRQETWNRSHAYAFQQEINHRYEDDRQRRMHDQWHAGQEVVPDPPMIDYTTLPPYDGSISYPIPPMHHSVWIDPRQSQAQTQQQEGGEAGAFGFGEFSDTFTQIFGPPQPRYY
ncbi:hypothetical protein SSX86_028892 [Deinandra increscens subsp. villosa]|uniref:Putative plant transposon protein domain-containing protein n=1 Tax=Deinandra increscens subsp. villosa TaxID=3103831 RepID=A0AAP0C8J4_9ASTR